MKLHSYAEHESMSRLSTPQSRARRFSQVVSERAMAETEDGNDPRYGAPVETSP